MLVKTSKEVTDRQKAFVFLHSVFLLQGPVVASRLLSDLFGSESGEGEQPGFLSVILGFARALEKRLAWLVAADEEHYIKKAVYTADLKQRESLTRSLTRLVVGLRRTILGQHDQADMGQLGFEAETAREAVPVLRQADRIAEIFARGEITDILGPPIFQDDPFDPKDKGEQVKTRADKLRAVLVKIGDSVRQSEDTYLKKVEAQKDYDKVFLRAARIFEDCCRLVGFDDLADRIRPSEKRPGLTEEEPPAVVPEVPEETAAEAPEAETPKAETPEAETSDGEESSEPAAAG